jgi:hypothetical protein
LLKLQDAEQQQIIRVIDIDIQRWQGDEIPSAAA